MPTITIPPGLYTYAHALVLLAGCRWSARYYISTYTPLKKMFGYSLDLLSKMSVYIRAYIFVMVAVWQLRTLSPALAHMEF